MPYNTTNNPPNINPNGWNLEDRPEDIQTADKHYEDRAPVYPPAKSWDDINEENKEGYFEIAEVIRGISPGKKVYIYGSRKDGRFNEESDWDIVIQVDTLEERADWLDLDFADLLSESEIVTTKVDVKFRYVPEDVDDTQDGDLDFLIPETLE